MGLKPKYIKPNRKGSNMKENWIIKSMKEY